MSSFCCSTSGVWVFSRQAPPPWIRLEHHLGDLSSEASSLPVRLADRFLIQDLWSERGLMPIHDVGMCRKDARSSLPLYLSKSSPHLRRLPPASTKTSFTSPHFNQKKQPWIVLFFLLLSASARLLFGYGTGDGIPASFPGVRKHERLGVGTANAHHSQTGPRKAVEK